MKETAEAYLCRVARPFEKKAANAVFSNHFQMPALAPPPPAFRKRGCTSELSATRGYVGNGDDFRPVARGSRGARLQGGQGPQNLKWPRHGPQLWGEGGSCFRVGGRSFRLKCLGFDLKGAFKRLFKWFFASFSNSVVGTVVLLRSPLRGRLARVPRQDDSAYRMQCKVVKQPDLPPIQPMLYRQMREISSKK